jgi:hypothetical protein
MPSDDNRAHIHLKVGAEKKESWKTYVERRDDLSSLSALIRLVVEKEISGQYDQTEEKYDEIIDVLNDIHSELSFQNEQLDILQAGTNTQAKEKSES